jgi:hypothetical protein
MSRREILHGVRALAKSNVEMTFPFSNTPRLGGLPSTVVRAFAAVWLCSSGRLKLYDVEAVHARVWAQYHILHLVSHKLCVPNTLHHTLCAVLYLHGCG